MVSLVRARYILAPLSYAVAISTSILAGCGGSGSSEKTASLHPQRWTVNELQPTVVGYPSRGIVLGQAYDFVDRRWLSTVCVSGKSVDLGAGEMTVRYTDLFDRKQVFDSLKLSVSAEASFGGGSGSASVEHSKSVTVKAERRNVMVNIDSMKGGVQLAPAEGALGVSLTSDASKNLRAKDGDGFRSNCGDGFAIAIRTGARLNGVMSYAMDSEEVNEMLKVGASGGYGPVKAKASMERIAKKEGATQQSDLSLLQVGGSRDSTPTTIEALITKIEAFGKYQMPDAVPLEVVVIPYKALSGLPEDFRERILPDLGVRGLAAHYWRLVDLSGLYARAAVRPADYYHPYIEPGDALNRKARVLQNAARCVSLMLEQCSVMGTPEACTMDGLAKEPAAKGPVMNDKVCIHGRSDLPDDEIIEVLETAVGTTDADKLLASSKRFQVEKAADALFRWRKPAQRKSDFLTFSQVTSPKLAAPEDGAKARWRPTVYDSWFMSYAQAPWPRIVGSTGEANPDAATDLHSLLTSFCKSANVDCYNIADGKAANAVTPTFVNTTLAKDLNKEGETAGHTDASTRPTRADVFRDFVIAVRLFPVASAVCESEIDHPMCQLPDVLRFYVSTAEEITPATFGGKRFFTKPTPPKGAAAKIERTPRPCSGRAGRGCYGEPL